MKTTEEDSGFEEDSDNNIFLNEVRSRSSSSSPRRMPESAKEEIIPCIPLAHSGISLEPDMLFGWRPKSLLSGGPIPLSFTGDVIPCKNSIFYGYRPEDSLELHDNFSGVNSYHYHINPTIRQAFMIIKKKSGKKDTRPFVGMKTDIEETLIFESKFESGNLDKVAKVKDDEYDLYIRNDTNTYGKNQWYYFKVQNTGEQREVKMNIVNFCKQDSLYSQGLQPCIYRENHPQKGWHYMCENIKYSFSKINKNLLNKRIYYGLSFTIMFPANETLRFAYSVPYTYSELLSFISCVKDSKYMKKEMLCKSLSGIEVPMLTITDYSIKAKKENVIVTARVHPGETHGSWMMQGFILFLLGVSYEAMRLREQFTFKIIPMLNPDGVVVGNSRCSLNGQDLNRQFQHPDHLLHPEIYHLKSLIYGTKNIITYLDFHAHSKKKGVFFYGPYFPLHSDYHCKIRVIPRLLSESTEIFRYYSCKFRNDWSKRKAARLVVSKEYSLPFSYTIEASSYGYLKADRSTVVLTPSILQEVGKSILCALLQYIDLRDEEIRQKEARAELRQKKSLRLSPIKDREAEPKRTMEELLEVIKNDLENEDESDSGGSDSDANDEEEEMKMNKKIVSVFKQVNKLLYNPTSTKRYSHSQAPKSSKPHKKHEELDYQAKSTLAKYFSRACSDNKNKFRAESVKRPLESEKKSKQFTKPKELVSKFSYCRGLYALRPKAENMVLDRSMLKSKRKFKLGPKTAEWLQDEIL